MPNYADLTSVVANETDKAVLLSGQSIALLFTALGELKCWTGSGDFGRLTDAERDAVGAMVSRAERELMTEVQLNDFSDVHHHFFHYESVATSGAAIAKTLLSTVIHGWYGWQSPAALNDAWQTPDFYLDAGDYYFSLLFQKNNLSGIATFYLDGVQFEQIDLYAGSSQINQITSIALPVGASGLHNIRCVIEGKNAASGGYRFYLTSYWLSKFSIVG